MFLNKFCNLHLTKRVLNYTCVTKAQLLCILKNKKGDVPLSVLARTANIFIRKKPNKGKKRRNIYEQSN